MKRDTNGCHCNECCDLKTRIGKHLPLILPLLVVCVGLIEMSLSSILIGLGMWVVLYQLQKLNDKVDNCGPWY